MAGPTAPVADAIAAYHRASLAVLVDGEIWRQEAGNDEKRLMAWPRPYEGTQLNRLMSVLFNADVDVWLVLLKADDDPRSPAWPPDVRDPKMQVILRVMQHAMDAGYAAIQAEFGGLELNRRRDYINGVMEALADMAWRSGLPRGEAFATFGLNRRRGYRAADRSVTKKAKPKL